MIVPTLREGMHPSTLCVSVLVEAERRGTINSVPKYYSPITLLMP
jgi:hypothetical protein